MSGPVILICGVNFVSLWKSGDVNFRRLGFGPPLLLGSTKKIDMTRARLCNMHAGVRLAYVCGNVGPAALGDVRLSNDIISVLLISPAHRVLDRERCCQPVRR